MGYDGPKRPISNKARPDEPLFYILLVLIILFFIGLANYDKIIEVCPWLQWQIFKNLGYVVLPILGLFIIIAVLWALFKGPSEGPY